MKKTLLATAILSGLVSATAGAATVYDQDGTKLSIGGRAEVRGSFAGDDEGTMTDESRARINFAGETQISDSLTGFGFMEYELQDDTEDGTDLDARYLYAGLGTTIGAFSYGKQDTAPVLVSDMTDIMSYFGGEQQIIDAASGKQTNNFLYNGEFDALTVKIDYIAQSTEDTDAYGISALYSFDMGIDLAAAYGSAQDETKQYTFGIAYTYNDLYVAASYAAGDFSESEDFDAVEIVAQYKFTKEFRLIGLYAYQESEIGSVTTENTDYLSLEAQYRFNSSIRTFAAYQVNMLDDDSVNDDTLVVGLKYSF